MSEPVRLRGDPKAPNELRRLVGGAPLSRPMSRAFRARSSARVDRLAVVPAAAGMFLWLKGVAIAAGIGVTSVAIVVGTAAVLRPTASRSDETVLPTRKEVRPASPLPQAAPTTRGAPLAARAPLPAPTRAESPVQSARAAVPSSAGSASTEGQEDRLAKEAAMLEVARSSLEGDPARALATLDRHRAMFSSGVLAPERELLAIEALRRLGRIDLARSRGEELLAGASGSLYEERVRKILATLGER